MLAGRDGKQDGRVSNGLDEPRADRCPVRQLSGVILDDDARRRDGLIRTRSHEILLLAHDFVDMPTKSEDGTGLLLRCRWCMKTPSKAREDGCAKHELEEAGQIVLSEWNPDGVKYFKGRTCVTCERPIMEHWLRRGQGDTYFCYANQNQFSYGVTGCVHEVSNVRVPVEETGVRGAV